MRFSSAILPAFFACGTAAAVASQDHPALASRQWNVPSTTDIYCSWIGDRDRIYSRTDIDRVVSQVCNLQWPGQPRNLNLSLSRIEELAPALGRGNWRQYPIGMDPVLMAVDAVPFIPGSRNPSDPSQPPPRATPKIPRARDTLNITRDYLVFDESCRNVAVVADIGSWWAVIRPSFELCANGIIAPST